MTFRDDHISTFAIQCNVKNIDLYLPWLLAVEAGYSSLYIILLIKDPFKKKKAEKHSVSVTSPCMEKNTLPLISGLWSVTLSFEVVEILRKL